jgi:hypothetical protein
MELQVGDRASRAANRLPVHLADDAHQPLGPGKEAEDVLPLVIELGPPDRDEPRVIGPGLEAEAAEPFGVHNFGRHLRGRLPVPDHGRVVVEFCHVDTPKSRIKSTRK